MSKVNVCYKVGQRIKDEKRDLTITEVFVEKNKKGYREVRYKYICNKCGFDCGEHYRNGQLINDYTVSQSDLKKCNCACCTKCSKIVVPGINSIWDTARWLCALGVSEEDAKRYSRCSTAKIKVKCPNCGKEKAKKISVIHQDVSIGCPCGDGYSSGHKFVGEILKQLSVEYLDNHTPKWCNYYNKYKDKTCYGEYDIFIKSMKLIIEIDGHFHRKHNHLSGQTKEESEYIDNIKDKIANDNGFKVIRIPYYRINNFKNQVMDSELSKMFDLSAINWNDCKVKSLSSRVVEVCKYWNNKKEEETTTDLAEKFGVHRGTIREYLIKGSFELGICNYDPNEEIEKRRDKVAKTKSKKVKSVSIFKDGIYLGTFDSARELEKKSVEMYGCHLDSGSIGYVCKGVKRQHKGFTFMFEDGFHTYEEMMDNFKRPPNFKKIEVFKNGESLGIFNGCAEFIRYSEEVFGVKLSDSNICKVLKGERNHHKGFVFKYIENNNRELVI